MCSMVTIVNDIVLDIWKLRECILKVLITRKKLCKYVCWWVFTRLTVVISSQYIQIPNHDVVHLKLIVLYVNYTSIKYNKLFFLRLPLISFPKPWLPNPKESFERSPFLTHYSVYAANHSLLPYTILPLEPYGSMRNFLRLTPLLFFWS